MRAGSFYFASLLSWLARGATQRGRLAGKIDRTFLFIVCSGIGRALAPRPLTITKAVSCFDSDELFQ